MRQAPLPIGGGELLAGVRGERADRHLLGEELVEYPAGERELVIAARRLAGRFLPQAVGGARPFGILLEDRLVGREQGLENVSKVFVFDLVAI